MGTHYYALIITLSYKPKVSRNLQAYISGACRAFNRYISLKDQKFGIMKNIINTVFPPNFLDEGIILWITHKLWFGRMVHFVMFYVWNVILNIYVHVKSLINKWFRTSYFRGVFRTLSYISSGAICPNILNIDIWKDTKDTTRLLHKL